MTEWLLGGGCAGLIVGSFLATLVVRWPQGRSLGGRSACDGCHRPLRATELVPLVSALVQRGRCATCDAAIDPVHPVIEFACAAIGIVALAVAPGFAGVAGAVFGWLLVALAALDLRHFWLPDRLTGALAIAGLGSGLLDFAPPLADRLIGGAAGFASLWVIAVTYRRLRRRDGLGGGDPKLLGAIGLWLGWQALPFVLLGASAVGLLGVLVTIAMRRNISAATALPFGTLLAVAAFPMWVLSVT